MSELETTVLISPHQLENSRAPYVFGINVDLIKRLGVIRLNRFGQFNFTLRLLCTHCIM